MPRHNNNTHQNSHSKIRKRVSSSSSSSSVVRNYRFKRAVLVGKRVGSSTPVPTWKIIMAAGSRSPMHKLQNYENGVKYSSMDNVGVSHNHNAKRKEALSARKLAATLWEINGLHSPSSKIPPDHQHLLLDQQHPHSPVCEKFDGSKVGSHRRRSSAASQKLQITEYVAGAELDTEVPNHAPGENTFTLKTRLKDVNNSLIASKELVKVLFRILSQEEQQSSRITLVSALRVELDRARLQVDQLIHEQRYSGNEIDTLLKQLANEKAAWKSKQKERMRETVSSFAREVEVERKLRRQAERLNKKLGTELADIRSHFSRAVKELEGERRAREILEQTCDELARGIGDERGEVEELKKESLKVREEVEKERQMLQLADVLREERVQMKLAEARYEFEEKNAALERLKSELQGYLTNEGDQEYGEGHPDFDEFLRKMQLSSSQDVENEHSDQGEVDDGGEDSGDSELHSIELNVDNNKKSYNWNFENNGTNQNDSRRPSVEEVFKGRRSLSEKIQWESICLQKKASDGDVEWDFTANKQGNIIGFDRARLSYQGSASPALSTGRSSSLREACTAILQDLASKREKFEGGQCVGTKR